MLELPESRKLAWMRALIVFVALGVLLYLSGMVWSGWSDVLASLRQLGWAVLIPAAALASSAYLVRFARWQFCLVRLGHRVAYLRSFGVYLSGLALTTSPGKMGETVRSLLLLQDGVPVKHSFGAFLADRMSDVLGVCLLAVLAAAWRGDIAWLALTGLLGGMFASQGARSLFRTAWGARIWAWADKSFPRLPWKWAHSVVEAWCRLWSWPRMLGFAVLALLAYGTQAVVFVLLARQLGLSLPFAVGAEFFANATLFGAASLVPGGLGTMEAALVWQLTGIGASQGSAVAAAIAVRLVTLWLGIGLGCLALLGIARQLGAANVVQARDSL